MTAVLIAAALIIPLLFAVALCRAAARGDTKTAHARTRRVMATRQRLRDEAMEDALARKQLAWLREIWDMPTFDRQDHQP